MLLLIPKIFRRLQLELLETMAEDVRLVHDFILPLPKISSKEVRVLVTDQQKPRISDSRSSVTSMFI